MRAYTRVIRSSLWLKFCVCRYVACAMHFHLQFASALQKWDAIVASQSSPAAAQPAASQPSPAPVSDASSPVLNVVAEQSRLQIPQWDAPQTSSASHDGIASMVAAQVASCLTQDLAPSTLSVYQSTLNSVVGAAEAQLGTSFLPLGHEDKCMQLFGFLKASSSGTLTWSRVRVLKAALLQWHARHAQACVFDSWTPRLRAFWKGLAKQCSHSSTGKEPVSFAAITDYFTSTCKAPIPDVKLRNMAMVAVGFFGVRRGAEIVDLKLTDILEAQPAVVQFRVRCPKNDPLGLGQTCVIPDVAALGEASPSKIVHAWLQRRHALQSSNTSSEYLFVTTTGKRCGQGVSRDMLRKHVASSFGSQTAAHSLRKGGALFYARRGACTDATRQQGGWKTADVMQAVYTKLTVAEVRNEIMQVGASTSALEEIKQKLNSLGANEQEALAVPAAHVQPVLALIQANVTKFTTQTLLQTNAGRYLKWLQRHESESVRTSAVRLHTLIRSRWMAAKAAKRQRVQ